LHKLGEVHKLVCQLRWFAYLSPDCEGVVR